MSTKIWWFPIISALREIEEELVKFDCFEDGVAIEIFWKSLYSEQVQEIRDLVTNILQQSNIWLDRTCDGEQFYFPVVNRFYLQDLINEPWITPASIFTILIALTH